MGGSGFVRIARWTVALTPPGSLPITVRLDHSCCGDEGLAVRRSGHDQLSLRPNKPTWLEDVDAAACTCD